MFLEELTKFRDEAKVIQAKGEEIKGDIDKVKAHLAAEQNYQARFEKFLNGSGIPSQFTLPDLMLQAIEKAK